MRVPHIMTPTTSNNGHPVRIITFDVETRPATCDPTAGSRACPACRRIADGTMGPDDEVSALTLGCALDWTGDRITFTDVDTFWDWINERAPGRGPLWIINHNIAYDLMVLRWDSAMVERGWTADKIILPEPAGPFYVSWTRGTDRVIMANLANWWGMRPLSSIGAVIGEYKGGINPTEYRYRHAQVDSVEWRELEKYCAQDVTVVARAIEVWSRFCRDHDLGPFATTQAGQSLAAYRRRFLGTHQIHHHTNTRALLLERQAYLGARTEAFRIGTFKGSYHVLDVNSLYPYVMASFTYPTKLMGSVNNPNMVDLSNLASQKDSLLVARITVRVSEEHERTIPTRYEGRLVYPTGQFTTTLTTPELVQALANGIVTKCHEVAIYEQAPLFKEYVEYFYKLRMKYREAGNNVWYEIVKVFLNSLYGKFGQYNHEWTPSATALNLPSGTHVIDQEGARTTYRQLGNTLSERSSERHESYHSFPAIAAHVTAYARRHITTLRAIAGYPNVLYCDTDSLFVNDQGMANLAEHIDSTRLGALKLETSANVVTIRGLKDYEIGNKRKLKGIRKDAVQLSDGSYRQTQFRGIAGALREEEPDIARVGQIVKKPTGKYLKGHVGRDGWVTPIHLSQ